MNVQFFMMTGSRNAGGMFFAVQPLAQHLKALDCNCRVVAPRDKYTTQDSDSWSPIPVDSFDVIGPQALGFSKQIEALTGDSDIHHAHGIWMYHSRVNWLTAKKKRKPYIVSPHGMLDPWALRHRRWRKKVISWLYEWRHLNDAHCIHALCESEVAAIRSFGLKNPICVIPNAVDIPAVAPTENRSSVDQIGINKKQLVFLGRIHAKKGLGNLIKAFAATPTALRDDWELVIAGWDQNHQSELETLAAEHGIENSVNFTGPQFGADKETLLRNCDAFVLPSFSEGLPMSVLEAWAYAKPTLITTACNLPEGKLANATLECAPTASDTKESLQKLLSMSDVDRERMGQKARELTIDKFTWPVVSAQMMAVYRWLIDPTSTPPDTVRFN